MSNRKSKRSKWRLRQEVQPTTTQGKSPQLSSKGQLERQLEKGIFQHIGKWLRTMSGVVSTMLGGAGAVVALYVLWPRFEISPLQPLQSEEAFSYMFQVKSGCMYPVYDVEVFCFVYRLVAGPIRMNDVPAIEGVRFSRMPAGDSLSSPLPKMIFSGLLESADVGVVLSYKLPYLWKQKKMFRMSLAQDAEKRFFWHNQPVDIEFEKAWQQGEESIKQSRKWTNKP